MEEYRDLRLTVDGFCTVLDEAEFEGVARASCSSYLPDSHRALEELVAWAKVRHERSGAQIKIAW